MHAKAMGLEMSPPAFLSLNNSLIEVDAGFSGINYASAYAVIWTRFVSSQTFRPSIRALPSHKYVCAFST
uniref:Uncharacterized protein n=1 Tax=Oryza nivara TaxID=4536 RepID=A0A0E0G525_ORYNI